jgi:rhodanese-related sulfurtransferase
MLMVSRITTAQLEQQMTRGEPVTFVDARGEAAQPERGAVRVRLASLTRDAARVSRGCPVVVYGATDGDTEAARIADQLRVLGFSPVRILAGGFAAWQELQGRVQRDARQS